MYVPPSKRGIIGSGGSTPKGALTTTNPAQSQLTENEKKGRAIRKVGCHYLLFLKLNKYL